MKVHELKSLLDDLDPELDLVFDVDMERGRGSCGGVSYDCSVVGYKLTDPEDERFFEYEEDEQMKLQSDVVVIGVSVEEDWYD